MALRHSDLSQSCRFSCPRFCAGWSSLLRWLVLPRISSKAKALPIFIAGAALADACGIAGSILAPELKETYLVLSFMGLAQFIPSFALRQKD